MSAAPIHRAPAPELMGVYRPSSGTVAIIRDGEQVIFDEAEAVAIHAALGEALGMRTLGPRLLNEGVRAV